MVASCYVVDQNGIVGQFSVMHGPSGFSTLDIPFSSIQDMDSNPVDFALLDFLGFTFVGSQPDDVDSVFILGSISATSLDVQVGGTIIPTETASLLLAGALMSASWMIPVIVAGAGIGFILIRRK